MPRKAIGNVAQFLFVMCLFLVSTQFVAASSIVIAENGRTQTLICDSGESYNIGGNNNKLTFKGECSSLTVMGNGNQAWIEAVDAINVLGNSNTVSYGRGVKRDRPSTSNLGSGNTIKAGYKAGAEKGSDSSKGTSAEIESSGTGVQIQAGDSTVEIGTSEGGATVKVGKEGEGVKITAGGSSVSGSAIVIADDDQKKTINCEGGTVTISGDNNNFKLTGTCSHLAISGDENTITVDSVTSISVSGDDNQVFWKEGVGGKKPTVVDSGKGNSINRIQ